MSGVRGIKINLKIKKRTGSVTVESAITLTVFLFVIFSLAYIVKIFFIYNTVQTSLNDVSRNLANLSYFYHITGAKAFSDEINQLAREAGLKLDEQKNVIVNAIDSFNSFINSNDRSSHPIQQPSLETLIDALNSGQDLADLASDIINNPQEEAKLFMRVIAGKLNYEMTNKLVCFIAKNSLKSELGKRLKITNRDPASVLGIKNGIKGIDLNQSSVFGDSESIELVAKYKLEPFLFIPGLNLVNRVKIVAWTGGRGTSGKTEKDDVPNRTSPNSLWEDYDNTKLYFERGHLIEQEYLKMIKPDSRQLLQGTVFSTNTGVPAIDAYICKKSGRNSYTAELYDVFSLNPFLKTYSTRPGSMESQIKKHGKRLYEAGIPKGLQDKEISKIRRIVVLVVPENSEKVVDEAVNNAKKSLEKYGIEVILYRGFGEYIPEENNQAA